MADRHKRPTRTLRLPEGLASWLAQRAAGTGKSQHRLILEAIEAAKEADDERGAHQLPARPGV